MKMKKFYLFVSAICISALIAATIQILPEKPPAHADEPDAIETLFNMDIINGFENGELRGEQTLTRAEFAKILTTAFSGDFKTGNKLHFSDVPKNHWAYEHIAKAVSAGWLEGFSNGTFRPDDTLTYEQALTVMCRLLHLTDYSTPEYPADYVSAAIENSLSDRVNALIGESISREMASRIILNSIDYLDRKNAEEAYLSPRTSSKSYASGGGASYAKSGFAPAAMNEAYVEDGASMYVAPEYEPHPYENFNTEEYSAEAENVFKNVLTSPLSTFSIDTDTASYSNLRRFILNGQPIPNGSVRSEELINYFDYSPAKPESDKTFGVRHTVARCPWNEETILAMLTVTGEELTNPKPSNLVFLIDTSGSMYSPNKLPLVKQSLALLLDKLGSQDTISVVTYASGTGVALESTPASEKEKILSVIGSLHAGGSTAGASGINLAYEQAEKHKIDGNNRVILCTDGDFNVGISSEGDLEKLISTKRDSGIFLSVLGFGMGNYKDSKMETLADKGNGTYAYIDNLREAKKVLVDEMPKTIYTIAKDVKIQVEFNPEKVASYRLVGYENRILNNEDFENDAKDAGELGAGATVTVLYEIVPSNGSVQSDLRYQTSTTTGSDELMNVRIRHKPVDSDESILSEYPIGSVPEQNPGKDFNFACAVAEFGMILNNSQYSGTSSYDSVIALAAKSTGDDPYGIRTEFVQLVDLLRLRSAVGTIR